ncbi:MAG: hypothetical protein ABIS07_03585 [Dokdonella sp.]
MIAATCGADSMSSSFNTLVHDGDNFLIGDGSLRIAMTTTALTARFKRMGWPLALSFWISGMPAAVAAPFAYVANTRDKTLSVIDVATHAVVGDPIMVGLSPTDIAINPAGTRVYVANVDEDSISVIDTASNTVSTTITNVQAHYFAMNPSGSRLFVAGDYFVVVIDTATNAQVGSPIAIVTADKPNCPKVNGKMAYDPTTERLYVPARDCSGPINTPGILSIVDLRNGTAVANVAVGALPTSATRNADSTRIYVTNGWDSSISVVDAANVAETQTIAIGSLSFPANAVIDPSGAHVYVTNSSGGFVTLISTIDGSVGGSIAVAGGSYGIAMTSDGARLYITNSFYDSVSVIDTATGTVEQMSISVGRNPIAIAITRSDLLFANGFEQPK